MIPNVAEQLILEQFVTDDLTLKLYSNDITPAETDTAATFTEIAGGGYASKILVSGSWIITSGDPSQALYVAQDFAFTGVTNAPATVYGYYLVDSSNVLRGAERFSASVVPFTPENGSLIRITPRIQTS
jgi:hypothetical protein